MGMFDGFPCYWYLKDSLLFYPLKAFFKAGKICLQYIYNVFEDSNLELWQTLAHSNISMFHQTAVGKSQTIDTSVCYFNLRVSYQTCRTQRLTFVLSKFSSYSIQVVNHQKLTRSFVLHQWFCRHSSQVYRCLG